MGVMGVCVRVRSLVLGLLVLSFAFASSLSARTHLSGYVEQGGQRHLNSNIFSITRAGATQTNPYTMQSYPSATVTVYLTGTLTTATLYSDSAGTAKANPFTASSNAYWSFYIDDGTYDIRFSGGGITTPYTWSEISTTSGDVSVSVTGFGARCDGTTDDTVAIQAAINVTGGHTVTFPADTCKITDQILIAQDYITLQGAGTRATNILYVPTVGDEAAFKADKAAATTILYTSFRDLYISTTDTTFQKTGIWVVDGTGTTIERVQIGTDGAWTGGTPVSPFNTGGSIGVKLQGRDYYHISQLRSAADIPLFVGNNPNFASIDLDHSNIRELDLHPNGNNPSIYIESGANLTSNVFEKAALVFGGYGVYWNDTAGSSSLNNIFRDLRGEQFTSAGHMIYIANSAMVNRGLRLENILAGATTTIKGVYLRGIGTSVVIDGLTYNGTIECVNADNTVEALDWRNSDCQTSSTKSLGTLVDIMGKDFADTSSPMPLNGYWIYPSSPITAKKAVTENGVYVWSGTGTLADAATADITPGSGAIVTGMIAISFDGATLDGGIICSMSAGGIKTVSTSDATIAGCTGNVAGDFTLHYSSASSIVIRNNLGESVTYNYQMFFN